MDIRKVKKLIELLQESDVAVGVISGLGAKGYELALNAAMARLETSTDPT